MIIYVSTAKKDYVTEIPDDATTIDLNHTMEIDPKQTCEVYQLIRSGEKGKGLEISNNLVAMENPRTDDLLRLSFCGKIMIKPISIVEVNQRGPLAKSYRVQMGRCIVEAVDIKDNGKGRLRIV